MTKPTTEELAMEYRYRVEGRLALLPFSLAVEATTYPANCAVHSAAKPPQLAPAEVGTNMCHGCRNLMWNDLYVIELMWADLQDALVASRSRGGGERSGSDGGSAAPIDLSASEALGLARDAVWSIVQQLILDKPRVQLPADHGTDVLAGWLTKSHFSYLASHPSSRHLVLSYQDLQKAADAVRASVGSEVHRRPIVDSQCHQFVDDGTGNRLPCPGQLEGVVQADGSQSVECTVDMLHTIPMEQWLLLTARKGRRPARPRNPGLLSRARLATRQRQAASAEGP
ncbi:hypothetical protein ACX80O_02305 [Arthrobacter sp. Hz1]